MEIVSLHPYNQLHITLPESIGTNLDWTHRFSAPESVEETEWLTPTQKKIVSSLLEQVSYVTGVDPFGQYVTISFVDDERAVQNIVAACAVIGHILDLPVRSTWTLRMDEMMIKALKSYADFTGSKSFVQLETLDIKVGLRELQE